MVGASGFEPETFCTPSKRATRLRYAPKGSKRLEGIVTSQHAARQTETEEFSGKNFAAAR